MNILLATEEVTASPTEGLLVFSLHLARFLRKISSLTVAYAYGEPEPGLGASRSLSRKVLVTRKLLRLLRRGNFEIVIYLPSASLTHFGLLRGSLLRSIAGCPLILIALQDRPISSAHRIVSLPVRPDVILTPVDDMRNRLKYIGINADFIMPGYDEEKFRPVTPHEKESLRRKHGVPADKYTVLHVGHVKENRNMQVFLKYREWGHDIQPVIKAGYVDPTWRHRLRTAGVIVIDEYLENVHEIYQLADCYLFPVTDPLGALDFPLSVIEAAACNLPVITTRFGALPRIIPEGSGVTYFTNTSEIAGHVSRMRQQALASAAAVTDYSWTAVFDRYLKPHIGSLAARRREGNG